MPSVKKQDDGVGSKSRGVFASGLGAFAATVGSAVGLGNIWKFPTETGNNGGAAFVVAYLGFVVLMGIPIMVAEHAIGRKTRKNAVHAYGTVVPGKKGWSVFGWVGCVAAFLVMAFYTDVAGWVFAYIGKSVRVAIQGGTLDRRDFESVSQGTWFPLLCQAGVIALTTGVLAAGVSKGIERTTKILMPVLFVLLMACAVRSLALPGALQGVKYLFAFDVAKLTGPVLLSAMGLAFFKLSLGMGAMTTYGSYLPDNVRLFPNAVRVALADTGVSLLAGLAIFPGIFAFGEQPSAGPGLLFDIIPRVLGKMPLGNWFTVVFFILAAIAATGAMVSLMEVPVAWLSERKQMSRLKAGMLVGVAMFAVGALATLSRSHVLQHVTIFGKTFFDLFDGVSSNFLLPIGGLGIAVLVGWFLPRKDFLQELDKGSLRPRSVHRMLLFFLKYLAPILIGMVFLSKIGILPEK